MAVFQLRAPIRRSDFSELIQGSQNLASSQVSHALCPGAGNAACNQGSSAVQTGAGLLRSSCGDTNSSMKTRVYPTCRQNLVALHQGRVHQIGVHQMQKSVIL